MDDAFVDRSVGGVTELRIHGVSGTPPEGVLAHPHSERVKGDGEAGFYRRAWFGGPPARSFGDDRGRRREAYEWGGLTSGSGLRAFWLLLLPFLLVNLGYFMMPRPDGRVRFVRRTAHLLQRWFALSLTGTLILTAMEIAGDLVAWQCTSPGGPCRTDHGTKPGWLQVFATEWMAPAERRLALASLLPAAVVVLLWWLGRWTWAKHERTPMPEPRGAVSGAGLRLAERGLWNGADAVGRLRSLHVAGGFAVIALAVSLPFIADDVGMGMVVAASVVLIAAAVLAALPPVAARVGPGVAADRLNYWCAGVRWAAIAVYAVMLVLAAFDRMGAEPPRRPTLPGFDGLVGGLFFAQLGLLVVLLFVTVVLAAATRSADPDALYSRALLGLGAPVALLTGWLLAGAMAAGGATQFARFLGAPVTSSGAKSPGRLVLPGAYEWMALGAVALTAGLLLTATAFGLRWWWRRRVLDGRLRTLYPKDEVRERASAYCAAAGLTDSAGLALGVLGAYAALLITVGTVVYGLDYDWPDRVHWATTLGSWIIGAFVLGMLILGRDLYQRRALRRTVGILWDIGTFWPRAVHPFAPPCYSERVIPDLMRRVDALAPGEHDKVILSAHSQGSIIAATLVLQLDAPACRRVRLLTYGSPLARLYGRFFPAYFGTDALHRLEQTVTWCNLYRLTDPIGGPVRVHLSDKQLIDGGDIPIDHREIDHYLVDPPIRADGEDDPPVIYSHADYFTGPAYGECLTHLQHAQPADNSRGDAQRTIL
jgi:hypothetical protein